MKQIAILLAGFLFTGLVFNLSSCKKDTDCKATITCLDSAGVNPVSNAEVMLYALVKSPDGKTTYTADVTAKANSDNDGVVKFTFKLPAIYDIKATLATSTKTLVGTGIIKLEEGKTITKDVKLK
ncbi:MAG: hypothetical protein IT236_17295 [Bacteroidia bacterium]|nr:hypothetical protein [Bacteroidia bacterium]